MGAYNGPGWYWVNSKNVKGLAYVKASNWVPGGYIVGAFPCGEFECWGIVGAESIGKKLNA